MFPKKNNTESTVLLAHLVPGVRIIVDKSYTPQEYGFYASDEGINPASIAPGAIMTVAKPKRKKSGLIWVSLVDQGQQDWLSQRFVGELIRRGQGTLTGGSTNDILLSALSYLERQSNNTRHEAKVEAEGQIAGIEYAILIANRGPVEGVPETNNKTFRALLAKQLAQGMSDYGTIYTSYVGSYGGKPEHDFIRGYKRALLDLTDALDRQEAQTHEF